MPVPVTTIQARNSEKGAALLIVVLAIFAVAMAVALLGVGDFATKDNYDAVLITNQHQQFLMNELSAYVQRENKMPCPADPALAQTNAGFGFSRATCNGTTSDGIVPFRTLHLSMRDAMDGWGRFMTYHISPVLANISATTGGNSIFARCRRFSWFDDSPVATPFNVHPQKARFCCPPTDGGFAADSDMRVFASSANIPAGTTIDTIGRQANPAYYGNINTPYNGGAQGALGPLPAAAGNEELFAVAFISHGQNGGGAYLVNGTTSRQPTGTSADEQENADGDRDIVARPINVTGNSNDFDDIVMWRTQATLMSQINNGACYMPWR